MTRLRKMMLEELERRNYSEATTRCYIRTVEDFSRRFKCSPDGLGPVSSCPTNLFSLLPKVILTAPHLSFQQRFFSPRRVFAFPHLSRGQRQTYFPSIEFA